MIEAVTEMEGRIVRGYTEEENRGKGKIGLLELRVASEWCRKRKQRRALRANTALGPSLLGSRVARVSSEGSS